MIYTDECTAVYYLDRRTGRSPVYDYINDLPKRDRSKVFKYIEYLRLNNGVLDEPYTRHVKEKIRELRVDFARNRYRIFYFTFINKKIVFLHAFLKHTEKTPESEIHISERRYYEVLHNQELYEAKI